MADKKTSPEATVTPARTRPTSAPTASRARAVTKPAVTQPAIAPQASAEHKPVLVTAPADTLIEPIAATPAVAAPTSAAPIAEPNSPIKAAEAAFPPKEITMSTVTANIETLVKDLQDVLVASVKKGQEASLSAFTDWSEFVAARGQGFPSLPVPEFAKELPNPESLVANAFDFTGAVLASQREFAEKLLASLPK